MMVNNVAAAIWSNGKDKQKYYTSLEMPLPEGVPPYSAMTLMGGRMENVD